MNIASDEQLIQMLRKEMVPALGCTEPVACALACARCREELGAVPAKITVYTSGNVYKNGMGVGIPGTGMTGLPIAAALGCICGHTSYGLEVLKEVSEGNNLQRAKDLVSNDQVRVYLKEDCTDKLYAEACCEADGHTARVVIAGGHTNIIRVEKDDQVVFEKPYSVSTGKPKSEVEVTVKRIWEFINSVDTNEIDFLVDGAEMNKIISNEGLKNDYGLCIGKTLKENIEKGILNSDLLTTTLMHTTAASDARMDGCEKPVMTNSGSGNQGITVLLPIIVCAEHLKATKEQTIRALALGTLIASHIHQYMGHLSALCGILIAATGAASGITYLLGGNYDQVVNTIKTMCSNLTGMVCDGAKQGCALKVYSGVSAAVQASLLSINGVVTNNDGIVEEDIETTIRNIGILGTVGMEQTDRTILDIMCNKNNK